MYGLQFFGVSNSMENFPWISIGMEYYTIRSDFLKQIKRVLSEPCQEKTCFFAYAKTKAQVSCTINGQLLSPFFSTTLNNPSIC